VDNTQQNLLVQQHVNPGHVELERTHSGMVVNQQHLVGLVVDVKFITHQIMVPEVPL